MRTMSKLFPGFSLVFLIIIVMNFLLLLPPSVAASSTSQNVTSSSSSSSSKKKKKSDDFIRTSCGETLYPDLCYTSLVGYANNVQKDPALLARIAIGLSLFKARRLASNFSRAAADDYASYSSSYDQHNALLIKSALHDCVSVLGDATDQIRGSLKQMRSLILGGTSGESLRFGLSDVQTWMSAALTNEDTCTDGLEEVVETRNSGTGTGMNNNNNWEGLCYAATKVKQVTSNALALVNAYVTKISSPSSSYAAPAP